MKAVLRFFLHMRRVTNSEWYTGTANAIFQNLDYMEQYNPDYVLILSGDHIYKMDYEVMLDFHKANKADVTIAMYAGSDGRSQAVSASW